jgi:hypothetical protein
VAETAETSEDQLRVFVSYAREDQLFAEKLVECLKRCGLGVFWDRDLLIGEHVEKRIKRELANADIVLVLWTVNSIKKSYVRDEAKIAKRMEKLFHGRIGVEDADLPLGFGDFHAPDWGKSGSDEPAKRICDDVVRAAKERRASKAGKPPPSGTTTPPSGKRDPFQIRIIIGNLRIEYGRVLYSLMRSALLKKVDVPASPVPSGALAHGASRIRIPVLILGALLLLCFPLLLMTAPLWRPAQRPCEVQCLETALRQRQQTTDQAKFEAASKLLGERELRLTSADSAGATYRALKDSVLLEMMRTCTNECGSAGPRVSEAWTDVLVVQPSPGMIVGRGVPKATVLAGGQSCTTDREGRCRLPIRDVPLFSGTLTISAKHGDREAEVTREVSKILGGEITMSFETATSTVEVVVTSCGRNGKRLADATVLLNADGADVWREFCGAAFPDRPQDCREALLVNGSARFHVAGAPKKLRFVVKPDRHGAPHEYERDAGPGLFTLTYPQPCAVAPVAAKDGGHPKRCIEGEWIRIGNDPLERTPEEKERCVHPPANAGETWALSLDMHCRCVRSE